MKSFTLMSAFLSKKCFCGELTCANPMLRTSMLQAKNRIFKKYLVCADSKLEISMKQFNESNDLNSGKVSMKVRRFAPGLKYRSPMRTRPSVSFRLGQRQSAASLSLHNDKSRIIK